VPTSTALILLIAVMVALTALLRDRQPPQGFYRSFRFFGAAVA
jgi:hypothetical protein